jgi:hypothetical protein
VRSEGCGLYPGEQTAIAMKIKENIRIKQIGDDKILVYNDGNNLDYTRIISLNQSAAFLIEESMGKEFTVQEWAHRLSENYGIDETRALSDAQKLVDKLMQAGVFQPDTTAVE